MTITYILQWAQTVLDAAGKRTLVLIGIDGNFHVGLRKADSGDWQTNYSSTVGPCWPERATATRDIFVRFLDGVGKYFL